MPITGPCIITICQRQSTNWRKVIEFVITKGQVNHTLLAYIHLGDTICLNCYNGIVTRSSAEFWQHSQESTASVLKQPQVSLQASPPPQALPPPQPQSQLSSPFVLSFSKQ